MQLGLSELLDSLAILKEESKKAFIGKFRSKTFPKKHHLLREGQIARHLYYVAKGCAREYYYKDGREINNWFVFENEFLTCTSSFLGQKESFESIQLLEDSELLVISYEDLQVLYSRYPDINTLGRILVEKYFIWLEERNIFMKSSSAKEKYDFLMKEEPHIIQRIPLGHIASFLGVTLETLSRIRAGKPY